MPTANLNDVQIYYEDSGEGEAVLLAPPSWWPCDTWKINVVPFLSRRYRTIIFDCRGTGYSSKPDDGYTISQFAKDSAGLLEHLKISRVHVVGFALGGQIAQALAIERPDLIATLTMAAAGAGTPDLNIAMPGSANEAYWSFQEALKWRTPTLFFEDRSIHNRVGQIAAENPVAKAQVTRSGDRLTIIAAGRTAALAEDAADEFAREGQSARIEAVSLV